MSTRSGGHRRRRRRVAEQRGRPVGGEIWPGDKGEAETRSHVGQWDVSDVREAGAVAQLQAGDRVLRMEDQDALPSLLRLASLSHSVSRT